jgi:hypothetical protein
MSEKGKVVAELSDEKWLWDLALLCDISHYVNYLNNKLKGQQKLFSDMFRAVRAFEMKLKLFWKQSCDLLHKDVSVSVPFPVSMLYKLLLPWLRILK